MTRFLEPRLFTLGATAVAIFVVSARAMASREENETTHDGRFVSLSKEKFVASSPDGQKRTHALGKETIVFCDGRACKLGDLEAGMKIRVTTRASDEDIATRIEALDRHLNFTWRHARRPAVN